LNYGNCNFFSQCNPFNNCIKLHFTTLRNVVNLRTLFDCLIITIFESLSPIHVTALKIYVQLTQFPSIILRIINPSVHDGLSRYTRSIFLRWNLNGGRTVYPKIGRLDIEFTNRLSIPRVITLITHLRSLARESVAIIPVSALLDLIISISAVPEISSSRSRYFRSVPCEGMRSEATMMARLAEGAPDLIHYVSLLGGVYFIW